MSSITNKNRRVAQPAIIITNASADTNQVGDDHSCKRALIRSLTSNAGIVWLNLGTAATQDNCYPLAIGDGIEAAIDNTNEININLESGGDSVAVIYEA